MLTRDHRCCGILVAIGLLLCGFAQTTHAALIAYEGFDYATDGFNDGLEGDNGGTGWSGEWDDDSSNVQNAVVAPTLTVSSDLALPQLGNQSSVRSSSSGVGMLRPLATALGTDGTTAWLSYRTQNNNTASSEIFAVFYTSLGTARSTLFGATQTTGGQSASDGQFDVARSVTGSPNADIAARDTLNHFVLVRFDFGAANSDTVTVFWDPTTSTDLSGSGDAQISGFDASFDGVGMTAGAATLQIDEIYIGTQVFDVTTLVSPEPSTLVLAVLGLCGLCVRRSRKRQ